MHKSQNKKIEKSRTKSKHLKSINATKQLCTVLFRLFCFVCFSVEETFRPSTVAKRKFMLLSESFNAISRQRPILHSSSRMTFRPSDPLIIYSIKTSRESKSQELIKLRILLGSTHHLLLPSIRQKLCIQLRNILSSSCLFRYQSFQPFILQFQFGNLLFHFGDLVSHVFCGFFESLFALLFLNAEASRSRSVAPSFVFVGFYAGTFCRRKVNFGRVDEFTLAGGLLGRCDVVEGKAGEGVGGGCGGG
jgi:hypothetical protein